MSLEIRHPNINGTTPAQQIGQMRSYLYQLAEQLTTALAELESRTPKLYSSTGAELKAGEAEFEAVKPHILKSNEIMSAYLGGLSKRLSGKYLSKGDLTTLLTTLSLAETKL